MKRRTSLAVSLSTFVELICVVVVVYEGRSPDKVERIIEGREPITTLRCLYIRL